MQIQAAIQKLAMQMIVRIHRISAIRLFSSKYNPIELDTKWIEKISTVPTAQSNKPKFTMIMPPPNVTGSLHLGHTYSLFIQDAICRYQALKENHINWIPGTDHAGIAIESLVTKQSPASITKSQLQTNIEQFANTSRAKITTQLVKFLLLISLL